MHRDVGADRRGFRPATAVGTGDFIIHKAVPGYFQATSQPKALGERPVMVVLLPTIVTMVSLIIAIGILDTQH
jgi:hypothetical protein